MKAPKLLLPETIFGIELIPNGSWSQDAFGKDYGCEQSRRRWLCNAHLLNRKYIELAEEFNYFIIPEYHNFDGAVNYPVVEEPVFEGSSVTALRAGDSVHPCPEGFKQWVDSEYFFLKYILDRKDKGLL